MTLLLQHVANKYKFKAPSVPWAYEECATEIRLACFHVQSRCPEIYTNDVGCFL